MNYLGVNWVAVLLATVASTALGFLWYMVFSRPWLAAIGKTREQFAGGSGPGPFLSSALMQLVMAYSIALITPVLFGAITVGNGLWCALHVWIGFVITALVINHRQQAARWSLTLVDGFYLLGVLLVDGLVIGLFTPTL